jgi:outer membrane protein
MKKALFELAILLQLPNKEDFDISEVSEEALEEKRTLKESLNFASSTSATIKIAQEKVRFSKNEIHYYKTQYYPKITLDYSLGTSAQNIFDLEDDSFLDQFRNNFYQYVGVGMSIPIFNQGNTKVKLQQAKIKVKLQEVKLAQEQQVVKNRIETLAFDILTAKENYQAAKLTDTQTKTVYAFSEKAYEIGNINAFEFTGKRNEYVIAQLKKIQAKYELLFKQKLLETYFSD